MTDSTSATPAGWFGPDSPEYEAATSPRNSSARQRPAYVARPVDAAGVAAAVRECGARGLRAVVQATGHGAGGELGSDSVVVDTSQLTSLRIDADARTAVAGPGLTWGDVNAEAERHGLLGLAGSSPSVGIGGYTFGGGVGWLSRPHGMAAGVLREVTYVDGAGGVRHAVDDAIDEIDRDALWAFRGGGGVGIATELVFDLVPVPSLFAGYLLWPADRLADVVGAWAAAMARVADDVATSIAVLHAPPGPPVPPELQGQPVVHLAVAASTGGAGAEPLLRAVRAAATPVVDTWRPSDAGRLAGIHLDPPVATPALGDAWWLTDAAPSVALDVLSTAVGDSPVVMLELRSVGNDAAAPDGAQSRVAGPYLAHAVAPDPGPEGRAGVHDAFAGIRRAAGAADTGQRAGSWVEGSTSVPDALAAGVRERVAAIADRVDPGKIIRRSRFVE